MRRDEHELLSRTGPGTPMGNLLRRYWIPALLSRELEAEGAPVRVRLLSENLIGFRDGQGRVGLLGEHCAHRGASLYYGRNLNGGLSCWYHGWKYDIDGKCLDQPNEPPETRFCDRVRQKAYPCVDRNGVIWTYMGPPEKQPDFPEFEWNLVPENHVYASKRYQDCHWLQGMEGDLDSSHLNFLHGQETINASPSHGKYPSGKWMADDPNPKIEIVQLPGGILQGARRDAEPGQHYWRIGEWMLPCFTTIPGFPGDAPFGGHAWVPSDDDKTWCFAFSWHPIRPLKDAELKNMLSGWGMHSLLKPGTFLAAHNKANGYAPEDFPPARQPWQRIKIFQDQDTAITESMGARFDRTEESLGSTDGLIMHTRRRLMAAARDLEEGKDPPTDKRNYRLRPLSCLLPTDTTDWAKAVADTIDARAETYQISV
jgi:phthalate 4,5-dioxygenase